MCLPGNIHSGTIVPHTLHPHFPLTRLVQEHARETRLTTGGHVFGVTDLRFVGSGMCHLASWVWRGRMHLPTRTRGPAPTCVGEEQLLSTDTNGELRLWSVEGHAPATAAPAPLAVVHAHTATINRYIVSLFCLAVACLRMCAGAAGITPSVLPACSVATDESRQYCVTASDDQSLHLWDVDQLAHQNVQVLAGDRGLVTVILRSLLTYPYLCAASRLTVDSPRSG